MSNFAQFRMNTSSDSINDVYRTIWVGVVGEIWIHRNSIIFNRGVVYTSEVCTLMQTNVWSWMSVKSCSASILFSSWCLEPLECMQLIVWGILGWLVWTMLYLLVWWFLLDVGLCISCIRVDALLKWFAFIYLLLLIKKTLF